MVTQTRVTVLVKWPGLTIDEPRFGSIRDASDWNVFHRPSGEILIADGQRSSEWLP